MVEETVMDAAQVDVYVGVHKGLRHLLGRFSFEAGTTDWTDAAAVARLAAQWQVVTRLLDTHHHHEEKHIHPVLAEVSPGAHRRFEADHDAQQAVLADLAAHFDRLASGGVSAARKAQIGLEFYRGFSQFYADYLPHLHREEVEAERALHALCTAEDLGAMVGGLIASIPPDEMMLWIDCMAPAMNPRECADLLGQMKAGAPPEAFDAMADRARRAVGPSNWARLEALMAAPVV
ncbi:MAG: hemerythrin domain-containing protein [Sedimentisphaerales bacterium]|nr:hemerythrin domain-containing protein [Sedimentisphaerales bacterium]